MAIGFNPLSGNFDYTGIVGPTGATGPSGGPTGPTGASVTGPTGAASTVTGPTGANGGAPGGSTTQIQYNNAGAFGGVDLTYSSNTFRIGPADSGTPSSQYNTVQNASGTNISGAARYYDGSQSTGTGNGGSHIFRVAPAGTTGSSQNALATALTIGSDKGTTFGGNTTLYGDAANALALRNSTSAQTLQVYNTYTDASNYERGTITWSTNIFIIGTENAGTGSARNIRLNAGTVEFGGANIAAVGASGININNSRNLAFIGTYAGQVTWGDIGLARSAAGILKISNASTGAGALEMIEQTAPSAPSANAVRIYAEDNGAGKTRLMALFPSGAAQQIAIEP